MIPLFLFNTETRRKDPIAPQRGDEIRLYTCGPTIYDFAHIGNFRTYVVEDLLRRTLEFFGYRVLHVMNLTDVDDKTIRGAIAKGVSLSAFTTPYKEAFFQDVKTLHIEPAHHYPAATDYIPDMIALIHTLLEKKVAYKSPNGSIYFSIRKFPSYGRLSHLKLDELQVNASGDNDADEYTKDNLADFVLWKAHDPSRDGEIFWQSPFGPGRPGWHIECSAMATQLLGHTIDIHCGGVDNLFPHHENEIAQSECAFGCQFVRHWLHVEHLLVDHKKMSKSLGNFYTLRDLLKKGYTGAEVRYLLLATHYRTQLNFTLASLDAARASLQRISDWIYRLKEIASQAEPALPPWLLPFDSAFKSALADDLNISVALAALFDLIRESNGRLDQQALPPSEAASLLSLLAAWDKPLGVLPLSVAAATAPPPLLALLAEREEARKTKQFARSDALRDQILAAGYLIEDTPNGARLKKVPST
jgi:cysteinyl-tRNA synthetase